MEDKAFEVNIIDTKNNKKLNDLKKQVGAIHLSVFGLFLMISTSDLVGTLIPDDNIRYSIGISFFILLILVSVLLIRFVYIKTASKGVLKLMEDRLVFKIGQAENIINLNELSNIVFEVNDDEYSIVIAHKNKIARFKLDIVFQHEKKELKEFVSLWQEQGHDVQITNTSRFYEFDQKKAQNNCSPEHSRINFTETKIRYNRGIPVYPKTKLYYNNYSRAELFALSLICFDYLGWKLNHIQKDLIQAQTDPILKLMGSVVKMKFKDDHAIVSSYSNQNSLIEIGEKMNIKEFLENLSMLSNEYTSTALEKSYNNTLASVKSY